MTRKIVPAVKNIFSVALTIFCGIETVVWVKNTMVSVSETTVPAAQKVVSVALTIFCVVK